MKTYNYKLINTLLIVALSITIILWCHLRSELDKAKLIMEEVKIIDLRAQEKDVRVDADLSNILEILMRRTDMKVLDVVLTKEGGEIFIQCDNSPNLINSLLGELNTKVKQAYIKEMKLKSEKLELTLAFVK